MKNRNDNKIKVTFESSDGQTVSRTLDVKWSANACIDLKAYHSDALGENFKKTVIESIRDVITFDFIKDVLDEFETQALKAQK